MSDRRSRVDRVATALLAARGVSVCRLDDEDIQSVYLDADRVIAVWEGMDAASEADERGRLLRSIFGTYRPYQELDLRTLRQIDAANRKRAQPEEEKP